jgi:uncharacterized protein YraI
MKRIVRLACVLAVAAPVAAEAVATTCTVETAVRSGSRPGAAQ